MTRFITIILVLLFNIAVNAQPPKLVIEQVKGNAYIYTTWNTWQGNRIDANGMYVVTDAGVVIFDNPWDSTQLQPLFDSIWVRHQKKVIAAFSTHFHEDRTGGIDFYKSLSIPTYANEKTIDLCKKKNRNIPGNILEDDHEINIAGQRFEVFYPGPGHAPDNIVIYLTNEGILYGGCFVKSIESKDLGNLGDADVKAWPASIKNVIERFPKPVYVIPGHGSWKNNRGLEHTLALLNNNN